MRRARLVKRLERIEKGGNGWQGCAWINERLFPTRYAKPEVQISLNSSLSRTHNGLTLTISLEEAQEIETRSAPIRETARQLLEEYERNRNGSHSVEASAEVVDAGQSSEPTIPEQARPELKHTSSDRR